MVCDQEYDAVIIGCGPGGTVAGAELSQRGYSVLALEKNAFPRYHIGESLTGTVGGYLREIGLGDAMGRQGFPVKYGVRVVGARARSEFFVAVAPEPTWQVRRDEFDQLLLTWATGLGMEYRTGAVCDVLREDERVIGVAYRNDEGRTTPVRGRFVIDATGLSCYLSNQGIAGERIRDEFSDQVALFTQIRDCGRDPGLMRDNTVIYYSEPQHWAWVIPLNEEVASVGVVIPRAAYKRLGQEVKFADVSIPHHVMDWGLRNINPELHARCAGEWTEPVRVIRDYSYEVTPFAGDGWICVGDSHRFVDPIFSFGVSVAVKEGQLAAEAIDRAIQERDSERACAEYQRRCNIGQNAVADVVRYFWRFPAFFGVQAQGKYRDDIMKLFAGACYDEDPLPGLQMMRESLARCEVAR